MQSPLPLSPSRKAARLIGAVRYSSAQPCHLGHRAPRYTRNGECSECARLRLEARNKMKKKPRPTSSRKLALSQGQTFYYSEKPCPRGHIAKRQTSNAFCTACPRPKRKRRAEGMHYMPCMPCARGHLAPRFSSTGQCTACLKEWKKLWRASNPDKAKAEIQRWREKNKERIADAYREWRLQNLDFNIKRCQQWREDNPEKHLASKSRRRALELNAEGAWAGSDIGDMRSRQGNRCYWCCVSLKGIPTEVDHVIPLSAGGSNWPENLCLACRPCNRLKNQRMPLDFVLRLITNRCGQIKGKSSRLTSNKQIRLFVGH